MGAKRLTPGGYSMIRQAHVALAHVALLAGLLFCSACGPNSEERERVEYEQALAASQSALAGFAKNHNAVVVDLEELFDPPEQQFTAKLQEQLEGRLVAFRSDRSFD